LDWNAIRRQMADTWERLTARQRVLVVGAALVVVLTLALWSAIYARGPQYATVFSGLSEQDAADIVKQLQAQKTPYRLSDGGTTIQVPAKDVYSTRLALASAGLPSGGVVGFEIMDKTQLGATEFEQRVNYIRALQGELTRTITQISEIEEARVHIVLPEQSYFVTLAKPATAAVFVKLKPGVTLNKSQIQGIVNLVSRSVEGLKPEDVSVIDVHGYLLSADLGGDEAPDRVTSGLLDVQRSFQKDLEKSLQGLLEQVLGPGQVVARVTAELNFDQKTVDKDLFEPVTNDTGIVRSIEKLEETMSGSTQTPAGAAGTSSNIPGYAATTGSGQSTSDKTQTTTNYEINNIKEHSVIAPGTVKRLSVAVVVNRDNLSAKEQKAIEDTVRAAIGFDAARNDQITVNGIKFDTSMAEAVAADMKRTSASSRWVTLAARGALGLVVAFVLWRILFGGGSKREEVLSDVFTSEERRAQVIAQIGEQVPPEEAERRKLHEQIDQLAKKKPEEFAKLLKTWLAEE